MMYLMKLKHIHVKGFPPSVTLEEQLLEEDMDEEDEDGEEGEEGGQAGAGTGVRNSFLSRPFAPAPVLDIRYGG